MKARIILLSLLMVLVVGNGVYGSACGDAIEVTFYPQTSSISSVNNSIIIILTDTTHTTDIIPDTCDNNIDCWDQFEGGEVLFEAPINTSLFNDFGNTNPQPLSMFDSLYRIIINSSITGNYTINATLNITGESCTLNTTVEFTPPSPPNLTVTFQGLPNRLNVSQNYLFNVTINNTGLGNADSFWGILSTTNDPIVNITNKDIIISQISNGTSITIERNVTITNSYTNEISIDLTSSTHDVTVIPAIFNISGPPRLLSALSNISMQNGTNKTLTTSDIDSKIFDTESAKYGNELNISILGDSNINATTTNNGTLGEHNLTINMYDPAFTGNGTITINATDEDGLSAIFTFYVFVYNSTTEVCDGIDNNGNTLIDEDIEGRADDDFERSLVHECTNTYGNPGNQTCLSGILGSCIGEIADSGDGGGSSTTPPVPLSVQITRPDDGDSYVKGKSISCDVNVKGSNPILEEYWTFGDGNKGYQRSTSKTYSSVGSYNVKYQAEDDTGSKAQDSINIQVVECIDDYDCSNGKCIYPDSTESFCCEDICSSNSDCDDNSITTTDICGGGCCQHLACNPECTTNNDCDDNNLNTKDICKNIGTCEAYCENKLSSLEIIIIEPRKDYIYNTTIIPLEYDTSINTVSCKYRLNDEKPVKLFSNYATLKAKEGQNRIVVECDDEAASRTFYVNITDPIIESPLSFQEKQKLLLEQLFNFFGEDTKKSRLTEEQVIGILEDAIKSQGLQTLTSLSYIENKSKITTFIKNEQIIPRKNVKIQVTIPKEVVSDAKDIQGNFTVIQSDPTIEFYQEIVSFEKIQEINYELKTRLSEDALKSINTTILSQEVTEEDLKDLLEKEKLTERAVSVITNAIQIGNRTRVINKIIPKNNLTDLAVYIEIPKCLAQHINEVKFANPNYKVIKDDPLIMWHFSNAQDVIDLSYDIEGEIDEECKKQLATLPIANYIGANINGGEIIILKFLPLILIPLISIIFIYFSRYAKKHQAEEEMPSKAEMLAKRTAVHGLLNPKVQKVTSDLDGIERELNFLLKEVRR